MKYSRMLLVFVGLWVSSAPAKAWPATPAVVNPVFPSAHRGAICLDGPWDFAVDPRNEGERQGWFNPGQPLPGKKSVQVPGSWEAQGIGGAGDSTALTYETSIRPLIGAYVGTAWYRQEAAIPGDWAGKQIWLKVGGVHAQGWFWINGTYIAHWANYCGAYKYNITDLVRPGATMTIAAKVRNDVPGGKGLFGWVHRFGGLYRSVEIEATEPTWIDDAWVEPQLDKQQASVHIVLNSVKNAGGPYSVEVTVSTAEGTAAGRSARECTPAGGQAREMIVEVKLDPLRPWSPEYPHLYKADIVLQKDGRPIDGWAERFGMRKLEVRGGSFYLNNQPYFVRGFGDDFIYPLTLCSPASRQEHKKHLRLARDYGFNYVRLHTHCELPEYFEAADEIGIMVQPELPYYGQDPSERYDGAFKPMDDLLEIVTHYRRYISLTTYCMGNEGLMASPIDRELYQLARRWDPTRLVLHQDGGFNTRENSDFGGGPWQPWPPGRPEAFLKNYKLDVTRPFVCHEYLNLATDEDPRLAGKYTGAIKPPVTDESFNRALRESGLSREWGISCLEAGNQLQSIYQKRGLEQARRDPQCDGYIDWTIVDVGSPSAQGLFNQFWEPKAASADFFGQFNGPVALLAEFSPAERILNAGEKLIVKWWISYFDDRPLDDGVLKWALLAGGKIQAAGGITGIHVRAGDVKMLAVTTVVTPAAGALKLDLQAHIEKTNARNSWPVWIFPQAQSVAEAGKGICASAKVHAAISERYPRMAVAGTAEASPADLMLTDVLDGEAIRRLEQGRNVILLELAGPRPGVQLGWWTPADQRGTAVARHPAFGSFPHDGYLDESFFRLVGGTVCLRDEGYRAVEPLMVGNSRQGYLAYVFQAKARKGKILGTGLKLLSGHPEARYLLNEMITYTRSELFQPKGLMILAESEGR